MATDVTFADLVRDIENALLAVRARSGALGLLLVRAELELKATVKKSFDAGGKVTFLIVPLEASAQVERSEVQTFTLSLTPAGGAQSLGERESDELANAIVAMAAALEELTRNPRFVLGDATVSLNIQIEKGGKFLAFLGASGRSGHAHTMKLTFRKA